MTDALKNKVAEIAEKYNLTAVESIDPQKEGVGRLKEDTKICYDGEAKEVGQCEISNSNQSKAQRLKNATYHTFQ